MLATLCALVFLSAAAADAPPATAGSTTAGVQREEKVVRALEAWMKAYRAGKIDYLSPKSILKESIADRYGVLPKGMVGNLDSRRELQILLDGVTRLDSADAIAAVLQVAAVGLDKGKYTREMAPFIVRDLGEKALQQFKSNEAKDQLLKIARGEVKLDRGIEVAVRAAALRGIGLRKDGTFRSALEQQLGANEPPLRLAAAEGLGWLGDEAAAPALAEALGRETEENVIEAEVASLRALYASYLPDPTKAAAPTPKPDSAKEPADAKQAEPVAPAPAAPKPLPESSRLAVRAAIKALGRSSWRADLDLCAFLADFRSGESIPALIDVLQRYKDHPDEVQSGKLSGLVLHRAHGLLVAMTGAVYPADQPEQWRELWEHEQAALTAKAEAPPKPATDASGTVSQGLFGIPVQGTRVLFVVDLSGSMNFPMHGLGTAAAGAAPAKAQTRLDFAKKELKHVVETLPDATSFNFITYNGEEKPKVWHKTLVQATEKSREKAIKFLDDMVAEGGTNMWSGLEESLKMKSLVYGDRYDTNVDEMFLVSDGAPNVGEVIDPIEILRIVTETNRFSKVRINTIFITSPNERDPRDMAITPSELMQRMAAQNGGKFVKL